MVYFFNLIGMHFGNKISIPKHNNEFLRKENTLLYTAIIKGSKWYVQAFEGKEDENFWYYFSDTLAVSTVFFISDQKDLNQKLFNVLPEPSKFTNTNPDFRCNLQIFNSKGSHSSYQAEFPIQMTKLQGSVISSVRLLTSGGSKNWLYFRNVDKLPTVDMFKVALVDFNDGTVLQHIDGRRNHTLVIDLNLYRDAGDIWFVTKNVLSIPIYITEGCGGALSMEHTHPPHEVIFGSQKFQKIRSLKEHLYAMAFE